MHHATMINVIVLNFETHRIHWIVHKAKFKTEKRSLSPSSSQSSFSYVAFTRTLGRPLTLMTLQPAVQLSATQEQLFMQCAKKLGSSGGKL